VIVERKHLNRIIPTHVPKTISHAPVLLESSSIAVITEGGVMRRSFPPIPWECPKSRLACDASGSVEGGIGFNWCERSFSWMEGRVNIYTYLRRSSKEGITTSKLQQVVP